MFAEKIALNARKAISSFCYEECKAYCCRKGYLVLNGWEADLITDKMVDKHIQDGSIRKFGEDRYSFFLGLTDQPCPQLKDFKCRIHKNPKRPKACREFPVFVDEANKTVRLSHRCLAVKQGKFYAFESQWAKKGYNVIESSPLLDSEFYDKNVK
ncbi:MAG: YkgJ family cysteine cluster protein [Nanoarchaeota archaeon]|nr:YkgJ family cysteine cluster protein [Nanoarchaeota archaeon]